MAVAEKSVDVGVPQLQINNLCPLPVKELDINPIQHLSFEDLPEGSSPAKVLRCVELVEHTVHCNLSRCPQGESCSRTRQVLAHYISCRSGKTDGNVDCNICRQLLALCRNHSYRCQVTEGNCIVPHCKHKKRKADSKTNEIQTNKAPEDQSRQEYQFVVKKLSEAMDLPTKQQKLRGVQRLLETNREATVQVLRYILRRKQKSQLVSLNQKITELNIGKGKNPLTEISIRKALNPLRWSPAVTCALKVFVKAL